jgi:AcrR family transcriptional regulator
MDKRAVMLKRMTDDPESPEPEGLGGRVGDRYERRRADIVSAAIPVLNELGFKGMRLTAVAELIGLRATGVTYYFARKEELAVACFESGMAIFHELLSEAERETTAAGRVARLISRFIERDAAVRQGKATPLASFSSMRALEGEHYARVSSGYKEMFRRVRALLNSPDLVALDKAARTMRTLALLEQLYWATAWLADYDIEDFPRIAERMTDIVLHGLAPVGAEFRPGRVVLRPVGWDADAAKESFLLAATREINAHGYSGASVERISASLNVTKGAFYHHNDAKDDLVAACFRRSFGIVRDAQRQVRGQGPNEWWRLATAVSELVRFQLCADGPLLRSSVLSSMPREHQVEILNLSYKTSRQFAAMISDGISEGTIRPVDPTIAAHLLNAAINAAADLRWRDAPENCDALVYARPLFRGILQA